MASQVSKGVEHARVPTPDSLKGGEKKDWVAKWIWLEGDPIPKNFYLYCRKSVSLEGEIEDASVDVTADSRYKLYVNGKFVGRGPARCDQRWQYYDTHDIRQFLQRGENVISAVVHQYGAPTHSYTLGRGGFLLEGEVRERNGHNVRLDSDDSWRVLPAPPWDRGSPRICVAIMWMEIYDSREEPRGWQRPGYDDSSWQRPVVLGPHPVLPWENLVPRDIPYLREEEWFASAVVSSGIVEPAPPVVHVNFTELLGRTDGLAAYLFAYLNSPVEQQVALAFRGQEGMPPMMIRLWVNGEALGQREGPPLGPTSSLTLLNLRRGWNELLIKLGRMGAEWSWDVALGPAPRQRFAPIEWYAEPSSEAPRGRAWIMGPYGEVALAVRPEDFLDGRLMAIFATAHEPERVILNRAPGSPLQLPGKAVALEFRPTKNVALSMAMERQRPQITSGLREVRRLLKTSDGVCWVTTAGTGGDPYLTLDFGKEVAGYVRLRLNGAAGGIVDLGYGEMLIDGHVDTLRDNWNFADRYIMRDGPQDWELFFWKGFRYLQLTFRNCPSPVAVESVTLLFTSYPVKYRGSFECSDPMLTKIWEVGRWTLQLCMHDGYEDCPWREQGQWCGDAQVELQTNYVTFGDIALGTKCLRQIGQGQTEQGALPAEYPADISVYPARGSVPFGIPTFMAQWASMVLDHYYYTGDSSLVSELFPRLVQVIAYLGRFLDKDGLLNDVPGFVFLDWAPGLMGDNRGQLTGMNCHYYRALMDAAGLAGVVGEKNHQDEWLQKAEKLKLAINERLWSVERGVYAHARIGGQLASKIAVHDSVLAACTGVAPPERVSQTFANLLGKPHQDVVQIETPYFYFFYLRALRGAGRHQEALDATRRAYGKMLEAGATTWWEHFGGYASLCHAWSTAPTPDLSTEALGVKATSPGFTALRVEPQPADLTWAKGVVPTPRGDISVNWKRENTTFELSVTVPMKATVELSVPAKSLITTRLTSETKPRNQVFSGGRARYWVEGPGTFRLQAGAFKKRPEPRNP